MNSYSVCSGEGSDPPPAGGGHDAAIQVDRCPVSRVGPHARQLEATRSLDARGGTTREETRTGSARLAREPGVPSGEGARAREGRGARTRATGGVFWEWTWTWARAWLRPCVSWPWPVKLETGERSGTARLSCFSLPCLLALKIIFEYNIF